MGRSRRFFISSFLVAAAFFTSQTFAAITFFARTSNPADNGALDNSVARSISPPAGMQAGDFIYLVALVRTTSATLFISNTGGQSWTAKTQQQVSGSASVRAFTARFNGTWSANPIIDTSTHSGVSLTLVMTVFRPTNSANGWAVDVAQTTNNFSAPVSPFNVTATGHTPAAASTVTLVSFASIDDNSWALQTSGWTNPGGTSQFRNTAGNDTSLSLAYKIQTTAAPTGSVTNRQTANQPDAGQWIAETFAEVPPPIPAKRWHPGMGVQLIEQFNANNVAANLSTVQTRINELGTMPNVKSVLVWFRWGYLEPTRGNYQTAAIDSVIGYCQANGRKLFIGVADRTFSGSSVDFRIAQGDLPGYIKTDPEFSGLGPDGGWYNAVPTQNVQVPRLWNQAVMDRLIALHQALAAQYDNNPTVEGVMTSEVAITGDASYTHAAYLTQMKRLVSALDVAWPHGNVSVLANSGFGTLSNRQDFWQYMIDHHVLSGGPDVRPNDFVAGGAGGTQFQRIYRGIDGGVSYAGQIGTAYQIEGANLGGNHTPADFDPNTLVAFLYDKSFNLLNQSYIFWLYKTYTLDTNGEGAANDVYWNNTTPPNNVHPSIKEFLSQPASQIPVVTVCPGNYPGGCDTN